MAGEKERLPYIPIYYNDLTSDELVEAMSTEEFGAYMFLLFKAWKSEPPCTLPTDDQTLARYARLSDKRWAAVKGRVLAPFKLNSEGRLSQKRLLQVHAEVLEKVNQKREAGAKGGRAKAGRKASQNPSGASSDATAPPLATLEHRYDSATSETPSTTVADGWQNASNQNQRSKIKLSSSEEREPPPPFSTEGLNDAVVEIHDAEFKQTFRYETNCLRWRWLLVQRWNQLPGEITKHSSSDLSSHELKLLHARLQEYDWLWKDAMQMFPLNFPNISLSRFLAEGMVQKINAGDYKIPDFVKERDERRTGKSAGRSPQAIGAGQRYDATGAAERGINDF